MKYTSSSNITSRLDNKPNPTISAQKSMSNRPSIEVEADKTLLRTLNPCLTDCVIHHIDDAGASELPKAVFPHKESGPTRTLRRIRELYSNTRAVTNILQAWMPKPRWKEINEPLIHAL
jgi:hypothetical protein